MNTIDAKDDAFYLECFSGQCSALVSDDVRANILTCNCLPEQVLINVNSFQNIISGNDIADVS